ncbi:MAG: urease accessory protein UreD [Ktedonobacteraceae bacterium]
MEGRIPLIQDTAKQGIKGKLDVCFVRDEQQTRLLVREQKPPLKVIRAFPISNGGALVHLHNISGGVLGGDQLSLAVSIGQGAYAQLTSTSATRLYRSQADTTTAIQTNTILLEEGGLLEYLPDPLIPFAGSRYLQHTSIELSQNAGLFWWETVAPGRLAKGECFEYDVLEMSVKIAVQGKPIAIEHFKLEPASRPLSSLTRLGPYRYFCSFYICKVGVDTKEWQSLERRLGEIAQQLSCSHDVSWGVSTLVAHGLVVRALSKEGRTIATGLPAFWKAATLALYGREATLPRKIY